MSRTRAAAAEEKDTERIAEVISTTTETAADTFANRTQQQLTEVITQQSSLAGKMSPEFFDGRAGQDPYEWMAIFDRYAVLHKWPEVKKREVFDLCMRGRGYRWSITRPLIEPFSTRSAAFLTYFGEHGIKLQVLLDTCTQHINEPSKEYAERFLSLSSRAGAGLSDEQQVYKFAFGLQPAMRAEVLRHGPKTMEDVLRICEANEVADALDQLDLSGRTATMPFNAISSVTAKRSDKYHNNNNNNNTNHNNTPETTRPKDLDSMSRIDSKLDSVVSIMSDNTASLSELASTLRQSLMQQAMVRPPRIDQPYQPPLMLPGNMQQHMLNNNNNQYNRQRPYCDFCKRYTSTHGTEQCYKNPQYQRNGPMIQQNPIQQRPQIQTPLYPQTQDARVQPTTTYYPPNHNNNNNNNNNPNLRQQLPTSVTPATTTNTTATKPTNMQTLATFTVDSIGREKQSANRLFSAEASVHGIPIDKALIDTGAAVSAISLKFFRSLPAEVRAKITRDRSIKIVTAATAQMEVSGRLELNIQLGSAPVRGNKCELTGIPFIVIKQLSAECIIGQDILQTYFDGIDFLEKKLLYGTTWSNTPYFIHLNMYQGVADSNTHSNDEKENNSMQNIFQLTLMKSVHVLPEMNILVQAAAVDDITKLNSVLKNNPHYTAAYMEAAPNVAQQTDGNVTIEDGLYDVQQVTNTGQVLVQFRNSSQHAIRVRKGTLLGRLHLSSDDDITSQRLRLSNDDEQKTAVAIANISVQDDVSDNPIDHYLPLITTINEVKKNNPTDIIETMNLQQSDINDTERLQLTAVINEFIDRFAEDPQNPSRTTYITHEIHTGNHAPMRAQLKRFPPKEEEFIASKVAEMLKNGTVTRSRSAWASRPALVPKPNGELRFCINYIPLNRITEFDAYPIPNADASLDCLRDAFLFTSIDLASGYWQIRMNEKDAEKTAFLTKQGLFQFTVMPFGLSTAPATFVRLMNDVFADLLWISVIIYFDDIVIFSKDWNTHLSHIRQVMERLRQADLQAKASKCTFCVKKVSFLGYLILAGGIISTHPNKTKAIDEMPSPKNVTELRKALGLTNYYRRFVQDYATIAAPLYQLTSLNTSEENWPWSDECEIAFQELKRRLVTAPILHAPDWTAPFIIYTDASNHAMGAVLAQVLDGKERVIRYWSKIFNSAQRRYSATEREALAIISSLREFNCYLGGRPFTVVTDHQPLVGIKNVKDPHGRIARWMLEFQSHTFDIIYRSGEKNHVDALSRIVPHSDDHNAEHSSINVIGFNADDQKLDSGPPSASQMDRMLYDNDDDDDDDEDSAEDGDNDRHPIEIDVDDEKENDEDDDSPHPSDIDADQSDDDDNGELVTYETDDRVKLVRTIDGQPLDSIYIIVERVDPINYRLKAADDASIIITQPLSNFTHYYDTHERMRDGRPDVDIVGNIPTFNTAQRADTTLLSMINYVDGHKLPEDGQSSEAGTIISMSKDCHIDSNGTLVRVFQPTNGRTKLEVIKQIVLPRSVLPSVMSEFHDSPLAGHIGINKTYDKLRARYWWPTMFKDISNYINSCDLCQRRKSPLKVRWPIRSILPTGDQPQSREEEETVTFTPFSEVVVDVLGPLPMTARRKKFIVIFIDRLTRWPEAYATTNLRGNTIAQLLMNEIIPRYGAPRTLLSDQGSNFLGKLCTKLYNLMKIQKLQTSAYFPSCNGLVERFNRTIINMIAMFVKEQQNDWDLYINWTLFAYRTAVNVSTLYTPFYLLHGYEASYPMDIELRIANETFSSKEELAQIMAERVETARRVAVANLKLIDDKLVEKHKNLPRLPHYNAGDLILVYDPTTPPGKNAKLLRRWTGPYEVLARKSAVNYEVKAVNPISNYVKRVKKVHIYRMRPYKQPRATDVQHQ
jgi:RNase H-like domain found in reverse transcriptase/Reverse transcriptase (RNA-dependent DNA polymerase)/Integrase zinc binding domain